MHGNRLFAAISRHDLDDVLQATEPVSFPAGHVLYRPGEPIHFVYFPVSAVVSLVRPMSDGSMVEVAVAGNEGFVGVNALLGAHVWGDCAIVQVAGNALRMAATAFAALCERHKGLRQGLLRYADALLLQISQTAACNRLHSVEQRLCKWLLLCLDRTDGTTLTMTQEFIASMLGDRRETITVAERQLKAAGVIRYTRGQLSVLDRAGLEERTCECYAAVRP